MDLSIKEVADLIKVSETKIRSLLADGKIPAYKINQEYRFNRAEIEDWVFQYRQEKQANEDTLVDLSSGAIGGNKQFSLYRAIHKGGVLTNVPGATKEEVISSATKLIAKRMNLDADVLTELLLDREQLQPTALNNGIGIPHTRDFLLDAPIDVVTVVFPEKPIPYGAMDEKPVHTLFFLFAGDDKKHLHLLAKIAHLSSQAKTLQMLQSKPDKETLLSYIRDAESKL